MFQVLRSGGQSWLWGAEKVDQPLTGAVIPPTETIVKAPSSTAPSSTAPSSTAPTTTRIFATTAVLRVPSTFPVDPVSLSPNMETIQTASTTTHKSPLADSPAGSTTLSDVNRVLENVGTEIQV